MDIFDAAAAFAREEERLFGGAFPAAYSTGIGILFGAGGGGYVGHGGDGWRVGVIHSM